MNEFFQEALNPINLRVVFIVVADNRVGTYYRYHNLARGLVARGHEVKIFSQKYQGGSSGLIETRDGVQYIVEPSFHGHSWIDFSLNPLNILTRLFSRIPKSDVYHLFQPLESSALKWLHLSWKLRKQGSLFGWDWDDLWYEGLHDPTVCKTLWQQWRGMLFDVFERWLPHRTTLVTTCSTYLANLAMKRGALRAEVVHNGFWPDAKLSIRLPRGTPECVENRRTLGLQPEAFYLGFIGWTPMALEWCFEVLQKLQPRLNGVQIRLACCGFDIRKRLEQFGDVASRVDYLGVLPPDDSRRLMQVLDLGLLPLDNTKFNESRLPIKFTEYLAAGLPEVCAEIGESGALGRQLPGVILSRPERDSWVHCVCDTVRRMLLQGEEFRPDAAKLANMLSWQRLAEKLETLYVDGLRVVRASSPHS